MDLLSFVLSITAISLLQLFSGKTDWGGRAYWLLPFVNAHVREDDATTAIMWAKRQYLQRIRDVERSSFSHLCSPLPVEWPRKHLFFFYKRLASLLSELHEQTYSTTMAWLRCVLSFSLLRSSILCFRGHRSVVGKSIRANLHLPVDVIRAESSWSPLG